MAERALLALDSKPKPLYYIVAVELLTDETREDPADSLIAYSIIKVIAGEGAFEVDRAYRSVQEAMDTWPEALPPRS